MNAEENWISLDSNKSHSSNNLLLKQEIIANQMFKRDSVAAINLITLKKAVEEKAKLASLLAEEKMEYCPIKTCGKKMGYCLVKRWRKNMGYSSIKARKKHYWHGE